MYSNRIRWPSFRWHRESFLSLAALALVTLVAALDKPAGPAFQVTGQITVQTYHKNKDGFSFSVVGRARLRLTNVSKENLIVPRSFADCAQIKVARDSEAFAHRVFEYRSNYDCTSEIVFADGTVLRTPPSNPEIPVSPGPGFVILKPDDYIEGATQFGIESVAPPGHSAQFPTGDHLLQVIGGNSLLFRDDNEEEKTRARWRKFGVLIHDQFESEPFPFHIPDNPEPPAPK